MTNEGKYYYDLRNFVNLNAKKIDGDQLQLPNGKIIVKRNYKPMKTKEKNITLY